MFIRQVTENALNSYHVTMLVLCHLQKLIGLTKILKAFERRYILLIYCNFRFLNERGVV
jgi:hypothetical protein